MSVYNVLPSFFGETGRYVTNRLGSCHCYGCATLVVQSNSTTLYGRSTFGWTT
jgi:hypothetical protein